MKRSKVEVMFIEETERKLKIYSFIALIIIASILALSFFTIYFKNNKTEYIKYTEDSSIDYQVYLKDNEFFEEKYLGKDREYIASLIDYINASFSYDIKLDQNNVDFTYTRRIDAEVEVYDVNGKKPLYKVVENLMPEKLGQSHSQESVGINEIVKIDYNHYNDLINDFKKQYELVNTTSMLTIRMYVSVKGNCNNLEENPDTETEISLKIPLTTKTMSIEMESNLVQNDDGLFVCKKTENILHILICGIFFTVVVIGLIIYLSIYVVKSRSPRDIYKKELKRILNNYHSFIQKINNDLNIKNYQVLKVDTFTDMLEIRDTLQQPILMVESKENNGVHFIIPSNTKILYTYTLKEQDIKKRLESDEDLKI